MSRALTPALALKPSTTVRRVRELPVKGEILKLPGDKVKASDIVARADLPGELHILRIAEKMSLTPEEVMAGLKVQKGQQIKKGDVLFEHVGLFGLFRSRYESPYAGNLELITEKNGHLGLRLSPEPIEINAYISGSVLSVEEGRSLAIESRAAFVQGIFGVGGERQGVLKALALNPTEAITPQAIPSECAGMILFGGSAPSLEALQLASKRGALGMLVGSIDDRALAAYLGYDLGVAVTGDEDLSMTLIVSEGFGNLAMSEHVFTLLKSLEGKPASINGATQVRAGALRPEIIVPHDLDVKAEHDQESDLTLKLDARIRIIRFPFFGQFARVVELPSEPQKIETGAYARVLRAKLQDGTIVTVPRANVELT